MREGDLLFGEDDEKINGSREKDEEEPNTGGKEKYDGAPYFHKKDISLRTTRTSKCSKYVRKSSSISNETVELGLQALLRKTNRRSIASYMDHKDNEEKKASGLIYRNALSFDELIF